MQTKNRWVKKGFNKNIFQVLILPLQREEKICKKIEQTRNWKFSHV